MLWFFLCVLLLLMGYFFYSKLIEKIFVINPTRKTPALSMQDGVDYVPMSKKKIWLIQLLNIAGLVNFWSYFRCIVWTCRNVMDCVWLCICRGST